MQKIINSSKTIGSYLQMTCADNKEIF
jgi:hypothetical protein